VVIANRGEPVVRLVPAGTLSAGKMNAGSARAIIGWLERHPLPPYARRSAEEIDASIEAERNAWD
jgi:antitoxin (DNA-binding transcriptional repressor) of toxin-antitoxin stability system